MNVGERIKLLRRSLDMTQQAFADRLGVKRNTIGTYEIGRNAPIDAVISLICREFNVSETWLRTGEGEMFAARSREDELAAAVEQLMTGEDSEFRRRLVVALSRFSPSDWERLERELRFILDGEQDGENVPTADPTPSSAPKPWAAMTREEKIAEFTRQLDEEEKNAGQGNQPVGGTSAG